MWTRGSTEQHHLHHKAGLALTVNIPAHLSQRLEPFRDYKYLSKLHSILPKDNSKKQQWINPCQIRDYFVTELAIHKDSYLTTRVSDQMVLRTLSSSWASSYNTGCRADNTPSN